MKYVILIYSNPESRKMWDGFSAEEQQAGLAYYASLTDELTAGGELVVSERLADPSDAIRLSGREDAVGSLGRDEVISSDGPFAEVKEVLAGFFLVEVGSPERALQIARRMPEAELGLVEIRPVQQM